MFSRLLPLNYNKASYNITDFVKLLYYYVNNYLLLYPTRYL